MIPPLPPGTRVLSFVFTDNGIAAQEITVLDNGMAIRNVCPYCAALKLMGENELVCDAVDTSDDTVQEFLQ